MKKTALICAVALLAIPFTFALAYAGNGAPSGTHYNLNLLGKNNCPGDDLKNTNRHNIMVLLDYHDTNADNTLGNGNCGDPNTESPDCLVNLDKRNKIFLKGDTDFQVTDGNACDGDGAGFTLPSDVATEWTIWARALGKPGGKATITLCGIADMGTVTTSDDEVVCSTDQVVLIRYSGRTSPDGTGKSTFKNVTKELTTIDYLDCTGLTCTQESATLFDPDFYQYLWDYDNYGLRLTQLRFYPVTQ